MKILLTGGSSGLGQALYQQLQIDHNVTAPNRQELDLSDSGSVINYVHTAYDMLINCAGTGIGGKIDFINHCSNNIEDILQINLVSPVLLTQSILQKNPASKIVNITSTNNSRYWPNDLAYSLSKKSLEDFGNMLRVEYPDINLLNVRLGLTKTNFNQNRYAECSERFVDIYTNKHLKVTDVVNKIVAVLFDPTVKDIEISP